jgi:hypothetical protein
MENLWCKECEIEFAQDSSIHTITHNNDGTASIDGVCLFCGADNMCLMHECPSCEEMVPIDSCPDDTLCPYCHQRHNDLGPDPSDLYKQSKM